MPNRKAIIETNKGSITIELYEDKTPITAGNFIDLVGRGFYNGLKFHRVIDNFMVQTGCPQGTGTGGPGYKFADEIHAENRHAVGTIAMANSGPNTNGSQLFITVAPTPWLDNKHTIFGEVVEGQDVANKISTLPRDRNDRPNTAVTLNHVKIERVA